MFRTKMLMKRSILLGITLLLPFAASAASVSESLKVKDEAIVTRGEFLRAAIMVLGLPTTNKEVTTTYARPIPKNLVPYVNAAKRNDAIATFGNDLALGTAITRGEAAQFLVRLQNLKPTNRTLSFSDAKKGSDLENALRVMVEKQWMKPVRSNLFGVSRSLTGLEAKAVLSAVIGKSTDTTSGAKPTSVIIQVKQRPAVQLPQGDLLRTIWQMINDEYLYQEKVDAKEAAYKAAEAFVNSVGDQYTTFMRPVDAQQFKNQIEGEVTGIGAQVEYKDNALTVVAPITGSPADKAGIRPGDKITAVDDVSIAGLNLTQAVNKIRGPKGTTVKLTIMRDGTSIEISVKRDTVSVPEIDISFQGGVAIVRLVQFGQTTDHHLRSLLQEVQKQNPKGVVLDLRNNPGGLLHAAEIVLSNFLPKGSGVAIIKSKTQEFTEVTVDEPTIGKDVPMIVLVNKGSASASEIVAGALQDYERATIVGEKSFGKGTVQQIVEFTDGSSLKMTIAEWLTPKRRKINGVGVEPDVQVLPGEGRDEVLLRAIDMLR